ncbi:transposase [Pandoraea sputorum]|uniref:transposase n=1 Tax=Pandoraea sputorum TaxID=93222 RepID=UPI002B310C23|nr:hypothetical protein THI4931_04240 [Pandoraea sputorum]
MRKIFTDEQIIGFLREAETGIPVKELCRQHGLSEAMVQYVRWHECIQREAAEESGGRKHPTAETAGGIAAGK